ncbi:monooxygenase component MmoB/DmpM [Caballeronia arvi]|uniref:Monooxygenase component MmoB/DmpM n=1 Tax=Caballeronia arvi TaxID=1777135 RepID=A0A158JBM9_9BURK|nr:MmoB/DmpM family protein [Caballeronia arvi]SAL65943.1 monooxygenase component MmoB/DmpM [Caballeronia arvi]
MADSVFIAFQANDDSRPIIEAIEADNPHAVVNAFPAMVKIDAVGKLVIRRESIEAIIGRDFDLRELQLNLISLSGNIDETDDEFIIEWKA